MYVGMNRARDLTSVVRPGVPHVRGDEPQGVHIPDDGRVRSPCTWG